MGVCLGLYGGVRECIGFSFIAMVCITSHWEGRRAGTGLIDATMYLSFQYLPFVRSFVRSFLKFYAAFILLSLILLPLHVTTNMYVHPQHLSTAYHDNSQPRLQAAIQVAGP
jgi:hypothetical protein